MKIDGKKLASEKLSKLKIRVRRLKSKNVTPTLAIILMGNNVASDIYVRQKGIKAKEIGALVKVLPVKETTTNEELEKLIKKLDKNPKVHGIILQRPAPGNIEVDRLTDLVSPSKEVDGFGSRPAYPVPVAQAVIIMLKYVYRQSKQKQGFKKWLNSKRVAAIGKGQTAGRPIIELLSKQEANPNIIDSKTKNRDQILKRSDIVVSAVGKHVLSAKDIKKNVILIGVGLFTDKKGKLKGDYEDSEVEGITSYYSPTPGGVGPLNVACLMENLVNAADKQTRTL
ncbi:MAG: bifunctional 5,10-methylenetetrahydrofolate dehydrogenase/5,10-methenyltetrahydrofolate cyclohydrolase [Candidatus Levybacteria bacterium]|nr:bifunctional 5,10-methylenetetrahydrofolate dehydrogenase/5,10-methenyltetrahydrofolate cyclohydrolase [Candidatus Levybacteria bacterium]